MELHSRERYFEAPAQGSPSTDVPIGANEVEINYGLPEVQANTNTNTNNESSSTATATPATIATIESHIAIDVETSPVSSDDLARLPVAQSALVARPSSSSAPSSSSVGGSSSGHGGAAPSSVVAQEAHPVEAVSVTVATPAANVPGAATAAFAEAVVCGDEEQGEPSEPGHFTASRRSLRASRSSSSSQSGELIERAVVISAGATQNPYYVTNFEAEMFQSRSTVNCFAYMDVLFTILDVYAANATGAWFILLVLSLVGPVCGIYGARHLLPKPTAVYLISCVIDLYLPLMAQLVVLLVTLLDSFKSVWTVILFVVQLFVTRMALSYYKALQTLGSERLEVLRQPEFLERAVAAQSSINTRLPRNQPSETSAAEIREAHHYLQREMGQR